MKISMKWIWLLFLPAYVTNSCASDPQQAQAFASPVQAPLADSVPATSSLEGKTVETRFLVPPGYVRVPTDTASFAAYLRQLPLHPEGYPVHLFDGSLKNYQDVHCAVIDLDVGRNNLQQCADAVMRLRAEYLYAQKRYTDIHFNFTNGFRAEYARWRRGERIRVAGNQVSWVPGSAASESYSEFRKYLNMVFSYAGTASLAKELTAADPATILPGDVWIKAGYPGHAVIVVDVVQHAQTGERRFLLAQSYMPAQEIHVLRNPDNPDLPWYAVPAPGQGLNTPEWVFEYSQLKRFGT